MTHLPIEDLEALALDELPADRTADVGAHLGTCPECARELSWLETEQTLLARRPSPDTAQLWPGVAARLTHPRRRPRWAWRVTVAAAGAAAAAAVLLVTVRPQKPQPVQSPAPQAARTERRPVIDPKTLAALDRAESDYRDAAKVLEAEYERLRPRLDPELARRWDETLTRARAQLGESRAVASDDVNVRMRVLDGYAGYLRSLRDVVQESEEANP
jgi:anti-sigma factor RsiW